MNRTDIINQLIKSFGYTSYLEIGVSGGYNLNQIRCKEKLGVDPDAKSRADIHITSDGFFAANSSDWDIVFIDGLHEWEQCQRDISNALRVSKCVVCHDMLPTTELMQKVPRETVEWTGDVWKAWLHFRAKRTDMLVVDCDYGVGVIHPMITSKKLKIDCNNFADWWPQRTEVMNVISPEDWLYLLRSTQSSPPQSQTRPASSTLSLKR